MKKYSILLSFFSSIYLCNTSCNSFNSFDKKSSEDSACEVEIKRAKQFFDSGQIFISMPNLEWKLKYYAEDALKERYHLKADVEIESGVPCVKQSSPIIQHGMDCFRIIMDSLILSSYGKNIYAVIERAADSLYKLYPDKYGSDVNISYDSPYQEAAFPGGTTKLNEFILKNIDYPKKSQRDSIEGKIFVSFTIDTNGKVIDPKILRGRTKEMDSACLSVVNKFPSWEPARNESNKKISSMYTLPINFKLK